MKKGAYIGLLLIILFFLPSVIPYDGSSVPGAVLPTAYNNQRLLADGSGPYADNGAALDVSFQGTFTTNASGWSATGQTYAADYTQGTSFSVLNASTVTWTAYVSVSPPAEVEDVSFSVDYPRLEWVPVSVTDPLGIAKSNPTDWTYSRGVLDVLSTAVTTYGLWRVEFLGGNHLYDLQFDLGGGSYEDTATYDVGEELEILGTTSFITGATSQLVLTDPTGTVWYTTTNTTLGSSSHEIPSFQYKKDITIDEAAVGADLDFFPVMISLTDAGLHDSAQSSGNDIVFVQNSMVLEHEIEIYNPTYSPTEARLVAWVKANVSGSVDTVISMYYGNPIVGAQENPSEVWTQSYSSVYHLGESATDEATSAVHYDSTSNSYYGNQTGNADATGLVGLGQDFDGTDDKVVVDSSLGFDPTGDLTVSGWFNLDSPFSSSSATPQVLMAKYLTGDDDMHIALAGTDYSQGTMTKGSLVFKMENNGNQKYKCSQRITWGSSNWFYFAVTIDSDTPNNNQIYINGQLDTNATAVAGSASYGNLTFSADWEIGGGFTDSQLPGGQGFFDGVMDEVRVSSTLRSAVWLQAEYFNLALPGSFYSVGSENERSDGAPKFTKAIDATALAGVWTASLHYNDSGSFADHRVGEYRRDFIVQHDSSLTMDSPSGLATMFVGDLLYIIVNLADDVTSDFVSGAAVTANWTDTGSPTVVTLEDYGDGRYGKALNTSDLEDNRRWRINVQSSHPYYNNASTFFNLDLTHDTSLTYDSLTSTPVGNYFEVSLVFTDAFNGQPIVGATIRFANGTEITPDWSGGGRYNLTLSSFGLNMGAHSYTFVAEPSSSYLVDGSVDVTFTLRAHFTSVTVSGDLLVPFSDDTPLSILLIDLDTGLPLDISAVQSFTFTTTNFGVQNDISPADYAFTLVTNAWTLGLESIDLTVSLSDSNYVTPDAYTFYVEIRAHYTSVTVIGDLMSPYGNDTAITVVLIDLDTGGAIAIGNVNSFSFASSYGTQFESSLSSFNVLLTTNSWAVTSTTVTLTVAMSSSNYFAPDDYDFQVVITNLATYMYHEPSTLRFSTSQDFLVTLRVNVSQPGPKYGLPVTGLIQGEFSVSGYTITIDNTDQAIGRYNLTISAASFGDGLHTITVYVNPSSVNYAGTSIIITFRYEPGLAALSSPNYPQVTTPFETDVQISLTYEDADSLTPITGATIGGDIVTYGQAYAGGVYTIWIDVTGYAKGSHQ
ncbi:MAG: hypothetical protein ACXABY_13660, partial [Candidatus Thorarchaeota archaeon]